MSNTIIIVSRVKPLQSFLTRWAIQSQVCLWLCVSNHFYPGEQYTHSCVSGYAYPIVSSQLSNTISGVSLVKPLRSFLSSWAIQSQVYLWVCLFNRFYQAEQYNLRCISGYASPIVSNQVSNTIIVVSLVMPTQSFLVSWAIQSHVRFWFCLSYYF